MLRKNNYLVANVTNQISAVLREVKQQFSEIPYTRFFEPLRITGTKSRFHFQFPSRINFHFTWTFENLEFHCIPKGRRSFRLSVNIVF